MTLAQILAAVADNVKRTDKDSVARTGVSLAFQRCAQYHAFRSMVSTEEVSVSAGVTSVTLPATPVRVFAVYWINGTQSWRIFGKSREWILRRVPNIDATPTPSYPQWGYLEGSRLKFVPGTSVEGVIRITAQFLPTLTNDVDENPVPGTDEAIIAYATSWLFKSVQDWQAASYWEQNYQSALMLAIDADQVQPFDEKFFDERGDDNRSWLPPEYDPFAGHMSGWYMR